MASCWRAFITEAWILEQPDPSLPIRLKRIREAPDEPDRDHSGGRRCLSSFYMVFWQEVVRNLCQAALAVFCSQAMLLELDAATSDPDLTRYLVAAKSPLNLCGDVHGQ